LRKQITEVLDHFLDGFCCRIKDAMNALKPAQPRCTWELALRL